MIKENIKLLAGAVGVYAVLLSLYWIPQLIK
jgi:hypothetical protein